MPKTILIPCVVIDLREIFNGEIAWEEAGAMILSASVGGGAPIVAGYSPVNEPWFLHAVFIDKSDAAKFESVVHDAVALGKRFYGEYPG